MFRTPDHYGYLNATGYFTDRFNMSLFGNYTGRMLVQHNAGYIAADRDELTRGFLDLGVQLSYTFRLTDIISMELNGGVKNLFNQFQNDIDQGAFRDSVYIYGPTMPRCYFVGLKFTM
jgi:outer membrane receptor for ferrienterochelin and colicins